MTPKTFAKNLRQNATDAEVALWYYLRAKRSGNLKFKRQQTIGRYIVDFVCLERKVVVELDGSQHLSREGYDQDRDAWLGQLGYLVLRFNNIEFLQNRETVVEKIVSVCLSRPLSRPSATLSLEGRGES